MHKSLIFVAAALTLFLSAPIALVAQYDQFGGTWKLNVAKSKYEPASAAPKSNTNKMEPFQGGGKGTTDGVDAQGKPTHTETRKPS